MNTEHQNPKTQLPRAIEEKPIVYDDEQLEEVREVAALPPIQLSPDEIEFAISLFARGFGHGDVVTILIEQFPERDAQARADDPFRKRLSDKLRICDPTSTVFAESRFKTLYHLHQEHVRETLEKQCPKKPANGTEPFNFKKLLNFRSFFNDPVRLGMHIANVKLRQIWSPRMGKIWACTPQNRTIGVNLAIFDNIPCRSV